MAVYTEVTDEALSAFLADYDLGRVLSFKGIAEGVENSNFLLRTEAGPFILTLYEKRVHEDDLPFFLGLMEHLADARRHLPAAGAIARGRGARAARGRAAAIVTFLDGLVDPAAARRRIAARSARRWRGCTRRARISRSGARNALSLERLAAAVRRGAAARRRSLAGPRRRDRGRARRSPGDLADGPAARASIHADLFPDNVFFLGDKLSGLIDFYFACNDFFAYDLAVCLNAWCFEPDGAFNVTKGMAMIAGYRAACAGSSRREVEALPMLARGAALRFMLTRLVDWLNVPPGALVAAERSARISAQAALPPAGRRARATTACARDGARSRSGPTAPARAIRAPAAGARS